MKKNMLFAAAIGLCLTVGAVQAADTGATEQARTAECNKKAGDKKGDERAAFMKNCLKAPAAPAETPVQAKMKKCSADAKDRKGDDRVKFLAECLK